MQSLARVSVTRQGIGVAKESASEMYLLLTGTGESSASSCCRVGTVWLQFCPGRTSCLRLVWKLFTRKGFEERKNTRLFEFVIVELLGDWAKFSFSLVGGL